MKPGQQTHSKAENSLWNKVMYMLSILPNGEFNVVSASQEAALMVVSFTYAKSNNVEQV